MTLQRQTVSMPVGSGQADDKARALVEGNELALDVRFPRTGLVAKRYPVDAVTSGGLPGGSGKVISVAEVDGSVVAKTTAGTFVLDTVSNVWRRANESAPVPSAALVDPLVRGGDAVFNVDVAIVQDIMCVVYAKRERSGAGGTTTAHTYVTFFDVADGALRVVSGPVELTGTVLGRIRVLGVETGSATRRFTVVAQTQANKVGYATYQLSTGTYTFGAFVDFTGVYYSASAKFGCATEAGLVFVVFPTTAATSICHLLSDAGNASLTDPSFALTCVMIDSANSRIICANTTPNVRLAAINLSGSFGSWSTLGWSVTAPTRVELARWSSTRIAVLLSGEPAAPFGVAPSVWGTEVRVYESNGTLAFSFHLANTFIHGVPYYISTWGESAYPMRTGTEPRRGQIARMGDNAGTTGPMVRVAATYSSAVYEYEGQVSQAHTCIDSTGTLFFAYQVATGATDIFAQGEVRADIVRVQVESPPPIRNISAASTRIFGDGSGASFAGGGYAAMLTLPRGDAPIITSIITVGSGSNTVPTDSEVFIRFAWVWVDQYGNQHRGAPTPYINDNNPLGNGGCSSQAIIGTAVSMFSRVVVVPLPPLAELTLAQERGGDLYLDVFQTQYDDPTAERFTDRIKPKRSSTWKDCVAVYFLNGQSADPDTELNQISYGVYVATTTSRYALPWMASELEPAAPAALLDLTSAQSRLWGLSAERRNTVQPTKPIQFGIAPEFATEIEFTIPSEGGDCVGIAAIDDKVIVFKQRRVFVVAGEPGDALGEGSTLQAPRMVSGDVGCVCAQSIVEGPFGVAFQSQRGFYVIDRGLSLRFVGDRVQGETVGRFCGALIPDQSEVRWVGATSSWLGSWASLGVMLVWDFLRDQWSVRTAPTTTAHAVVVDSVYAAAGTSVLKETTTDWTSAAHLQSLKTAWFKVSGVAGFQRVWRATLLAYHFTGHIRVNVFYDYNSTSAEEHRWTEEDLIALRNSDGRVLLSLRPVNQKCAAIQFQITEYLTLGEVIGDNPTAGIGRGHEIVSVDLEIGVKSGTVRRTLASNSKR